MSAAVVGVVVVLSQALGCGGLEGNPDTPGTQVVDIGALQADVPDGWATAPLPRECNRFGPGVLISNTSSHGFERYEAHPAEDACTTVWDLREAPEDLVLGDVSAFPLHVPTLGGGLPHDFPLPPELTTDEYNSATTAEPLCTCAFRHGFVTDGEATYSIRVWIGEEASASDRDAVDALIASIRRAQD